MLAITGGGSGAISTLLGRPGASSTVLEAVVPYAEASLRRWVGGGFDSACSEATARAMAIAAHERARQLEGGGDERYDDLPGGAGGELFGVGCTAGLASDRPKRGDHRVHVAVQTRRVTAAYSLTLAKGRRSRAEEEAAAASLVLHAIGATLGLVADSFEPGEGDRLEQRSKQASPVWEDMLYGGGQTALVDPSVDRNAFTVQPSYDRVLFPGAFAPPHAGHRAMAEVAQRRLGRRVTLELSLTNVDKPPIDYLALDDRLAAVPRVFGGGAFSGGMEVWLTRLPTFQQKSRNFRGATFVVGADTAVRIGDPRYYGGDQPARDAAVDEIAAARCRFLVFGRVAGERFQTLDDLPLPPALRELCDGVPESEFREDLSSTAIRRGGPAGASP